MSSHHSLRGLGALVVALTMLAATGTAHALPLYEASINEGGTWTGSCTEVGGTYTIQASGGDIWGGSDGMYFVYQEFDAADPFDFYAYVGSPTGFTGIEPAGTIDGWAKAGIMVRQSLNEQSQNAFSVIANTDANGINAQIRPEVGVTTLGYATTGSRTNHDTPVWLRLKYDGANLFETFYSDDPGGADPTNWTKVSDDTAMLMNAGFELTDTILVGLAVTAHQVNNLTQIDFQDVHGFVLYGNTLESLTSDYWDLAAAWNVTGGAPPGGIPDADSYATVDSTHIITVREENPPGTPLTNEAGRLDIRDGTVVVESGATLSVIDLVQIPSAATGTLTVNGTLDTAKIYSARTIDIGAGGKITAGDATLQDVTIGADGELVTGTATLQNLTLGAAGKLTTGDATMLAVTTGGNATVEVNAAATATATDLNLAAGSTFTKDGAGKLSFTSGANTIVPGDTVKVQGGGELSMQAASNPLGGGNLVLAGGTSTFTGAAVTVPDAPGYLDMSGFMNGGRLDDDLDFYDDGDAGLLADAPVGTTDFSGAFDINTDAVFRALIPEITRNDDYQTLFTGKFKTTVAGDYGFQFTNKDDRVALYIDLDKDGVFEVAGDEGDEGILTSLTNQSATVGLDADTEYNIAFGHMEFGGGSRIRALYSAPGGVNHVIDLQNPYDAAFFLGNPTLPGALDMRDSPVAVTATSTLNAVTYFDALFGPLTIDPGTTLTTTGARQGITFTDGVNATSGSTTITGAGAVGFDTVSDTNVGALNAAGADVTITKTGGGALIVDQASGNSSLGAGSLIDVQAGKLVGVYDAVGAVSPFGSAGLKIGDAEVVFDASDHAAYTFDLPIEVVGNATLTAGHTAGAETITVGSATNTVTMTGGMVLKAQGALGHTIQLDGAMSNDKGLEGVGGTVQVSRGGSVGYVKNTGGTLEINADLATVGGASMEPGLEHRGYHLKNDAYMDLDSNGGLMLETPYGTAILTDGPGDRGLDFDNDADFRNTGAIGQNDNYSNLFIGTMRVTMAGDYSFRNAGDDDQAGIWLDLDQDGVFESSTPGLGSDRGEQLSWESGTIYTKTLAAGDYLVGFTHAEGTGGSRCDFRINGPTLAGEEIVKPTDLDQYGMWLTQQAFNGIDVSAGTVDVNAHLNTSMVRVRGTGTLNVNATGTLTLEETDIQGGTVDFKPGATINPAEGIEIYQRGGDIITNQALGDPTAIWNISGGTYDSNGAITAWHMDIQGGTFTSDAAIETGQIDVDGGHMIINQAVTCVTGRDVANALNMAGFMNSGRSDTDMAFEGGGGLLDDTPVGTTLLTGNFDINGDAAFRALIPEITQNDDYQTLFTGKFVAPEDGDYRFELANKDDRVVLYLDLDQDGDFERPGDDGDERLLGLSNGNKTIHLDAGTYEVAFGHMEHAGGSRIRALVQTPSLTNRNINPGEAAQDGFWLATGAMPTLVRVANGIIDANSTVATDHLVVDGGGIYNANAIGSVGNIGATIDVNVGGRLNANLLDVLNGTTPNVAGTIDVTVDGGAAGAAPNMLPRGYVNFSFTQTPGNFPAIGLVPVSGIGGDLTGAVYSGTPNVTFSRDAILAPTAGPLPVRGDLANGGLVTDDLLYEGLLDVTSTAILSLGDNGVDSIYKGGAIGPEWSNSDVFEATVNDASAAGDGIRLLMVGDMTVNSTTTLNTADTVRGSQFRGVGELIITANQPVTLSGTSKLITRDGFFDPQDGSGIDTTGDFIVQLNEDTIDDGQTMVVTNGMIRLTHSAAIATPNAGTLQVGQNATLTIEDNANGRRPNWGTYDILAGGVLRINNNNRLKNGAAFNIDPDAYIFLNHDCAVNTADPNYKAMERMGFDNVNIIVSEDNFGEGLWLGDEKMLTAPVFQGQTVSTGTNINPSLSAPPSYVRFAKAGTGDLNIQSHVNLEGVDIYINDTPGVFYSLPASDADMSREWTELDGRVNIDRYNLECDDIEMFNGFLRLGNNDDFDITSGGALHVYEGAQLELQGNRPLILAKLQAGTLFPGGIQFDNGCGQSWLRHRDTTPLQQNITFTGVGTGHAYVRLEEEPNNNNQVHTWTNINLLNGAKVLLGRTDVDRTQERLHLNVTGTALITGDSFAINSATAVGGPATLFLGDPGAYGDWRDDIDVEYQGALSPGMTIDHYVTNSSNDVWGDTVDGTIVVRRSNGWHNALELLYGKTQPAPGVMETVWGHNTVIEAGSENGCTIQLRVEEGVEADSIAEWLPSTTYKNTFAGTIHVFDDRDPGTPPDPLDAATWDTTVDVELRGDRYVDPGEDDRVWVEFGRVDLEENAHIRYTENWCRVDIGEIHLLGGTGWVSNKANDNNFNIGDIYGNIATGAETLKLLTQADNDRILLIGTIHDGAIAEVVVPRGDVRLEENFAINGQLLLTEGRIELNDVGQYNSNNAAHVPAVPAGTGKLVLQRAGGWSGDRDGEFRIHYGRGEGDLLGDAGWGAGGYDVEVWYNNIVRMYVDEPDTGENVNKYEGTILVKGDGAPGSDARLRAERGDNRGGTGLVWFSDIQPDLDSETTLERGGDASPRLRADFNLVNGNAEVLGADGVFAQITTTSTTPTLLTVDKSASGTSTFDLTMGGSSDMLIDNAGGGAFRINGLHLNGRTLTVARTGGYPAEVWPECNTDLGGGLIDIVGYDAGGGNWTASGMEFRSSREGGNVTDAGTQIQLSHGSLLSGHVATKFTQAEQTFPGSVKIIEDGTTDTDAVLRTRVSDTAAVHEGWTPGRVQFDNLVMTAGSKAELARTDWGGMRSQLLIKSMTLQGNAEVFQNTSFSNFFIRDTIDAGAGAVLTIGGSEPTHLVGNIGTGLKFNGWGSIDPTATLGGPVEVDAGGIAVVQQAAAGTTFTVRAGGVLAVYDAAFAGTVVTDAGAAVALAADVAWDDDDVNPTGIMVAMEGHSQTITLDNPLTQIGG
ncbi:MAG TPA: hypothetical protein VM238_17300, partial [Phycisphaerae bacterium]|nr:hypothetical protein [Phycisphaerae bacterium]